MIFTDRINKVFRILGCSNARIARESKVDPSLISRFRTGSRQPRASSLQVKRLCGGLIRYAEKNGHMDKLRLECHLSGTGNPEEELIAFLTEKTEKNKSVKQSSHMIHGIFSEKLNMLMNSLGISNIRLARALNIDTSLVSRFRNGLRTPPKNSLLMTSLCRYLYKIIKSSGLKQEISKIIFLESETAEETEEKIIERFIGWLSYETGPYPTGEVDSFLEKIDSITIAALPQTVLSESLLTQDIRQDHQNEYVGTEGLRRAALRFLGEIAVSKKKHVIKLYSNKKLNWLSSDPVFLKKWASLMLAILRNNNQIKIIHNIDRNLTEMLIGIENWLPLYISGLIEGYFSKTEADTKFSHTLFVAPGTAGIYGSFVSGTEDGGVYHYASEPGRISYYEKQFDKLLSMSQPLVQVFKKEKANDFLFCRAEMSKAEGNLKRLLQSPSLATIPSDLLEQMLCRAEVGQAETEFIFNAHKNCVKQFETEMKNGHVIEYVVFPEDEQLYNGKVKLNLYDVFFEKSVFYTPDEYSRHIKAIIDLLENSNYDIIPLPESPFENIQIMVKEAAGAMVQKTDSPGAVFRFVNPLMCKVLSEYIDTIGQRNKLRISSKRELAEYLGKYML